MLQKLKQLPPVLTAATLPMPALAQMGPGYPGYWQDDWGWGWGHMIFGSVMMLVFWAAIILIVIFVVRLLGGGTPRGHGAQPAGRDALDILKERFARGEIDKEEFEERKRLLMS